jgi:hypothetical protein
LQRTASDVVIAAAFDPHATLALLELERTSRNNAAIGWSWSGLGGSENMGAASRYSIHHDRRHSKVSFAEKHQSNFSAISGGPVNRSERNSFPCEEAV